MSLRNYKTIKERQKFLEKATNFRFKAITTYPKDLEEAQFGNCENMIGATQMPLGVAGPLRIHGKYALGDYYIPLATTEGALVASVNRGCKAITAAGGAEVFGEFAGITRGSVFKTNGIKDGHRLKIWIDEHFSQLAQMTESTSSHLKLKKIDTRVVGRNVYTRFSFDTQDAMGMNMVTIAADAAARFIKEKTDNYRVTLAANFDIDKKPAWLNFILGRGRQVWAEVVLDKNIVKEVLKTTPEKLHEVVMQKCLLGSAISGSLGFNAHFANIIAAIFIATGQDVAHTVEGSLGITSTEIVNSKLYISVYLPDLPLGTVGGGTKLPAQKEALSLLGVSGGRKGRNASSFAEIVGAAALAGEISLLASLSEGSLASTHQKLARRFKSPRRLK